MNFEVTKLAAEFIDMDEANFDASMTEASQNPEIMKQIKKNEENVRVICEDLKETMPKEKAK